jgi:hypothetical protein
MGRWFWRLVASRVYLGKRGKPVPKAESIVFGYGIPISKEWLLSLQATAALNV